jgi:hypothetical protein
MTLNSTIEISMVRLWGVKQFHYQSIWQAHIPLKIKIFLWFVRQNRIFTREFN